MRINDDVTNVLANSKIENSLLFLPPEQLDRKLYLSVNKVLTAIGGKWNSSKKAHVFSKDPSSILEEILLTGEFIDTKTDYQFFETPNSLAIQLVEMACIQPGETILEPSAGKGKIARHIPGCDCIELNLDNRKYLTDNGFNLVGDDFLKFERDYDVIVANPPFANQQDITHIKHMSMMVRRCIVSVMSASVLFRTNPKTLKFRAFVDKFGGTIEPLPNNTFKESGTLVKTCVVKINF